MVVNIVIYKTSNTINTGSENSKKYTKNIIIFLHKLQHFKENPKKALENHIVK